MGAFITIVTNVIPSSVLVVTIDEEITASSIAVKVSSTFTPPQDVNHLIDGSGMDADRHDNHGAASTMWHTVEPPAASKPADGLPTAPVWVRPIALPYCKRTICQVP